MTAYWLKLGDMAPPSAWTTLEALAGRVDEDPALPPVVPDDFLYAARVQRPGLPDLHVFRHLLTGGYLDVDTLGGLWRFVGRGAGAEGYAQVGDLADALTRAGLDRAERLALRTRRGPRRPSAVPPTDAAEGAEEATALTVVADDDERALPGDDADPDADPELASA